MNTPLNSIVFDQVSFQYEVVPVLQDISFTIPQGSFTGIIGPNGSGKTTALKLMLGLLDPTKGSISIQGMPPKQAVWNNFIGYVPQHAAQQNNSFPASVLEIAMSGVGYTQRSLQEAQAAAIRALEDCAISHLKDVRADTLSGGQRQRMFIARALALQPKILLLDEPETGVDSSGEKEFYDLLRKVNEEQGATIIMITHNIDTISSVVSSVICINRNLTCHIESKDLYDSEFLKKMYADTARVHHHH